MIVLIFSRVLHFSPSPPPLPPFFSNFSYPGVRAAFCRCCGGVRVVCRQREGGVQQAWEGCEGCVQLREGEVAAELRQRCCGHVLCDDVWAALQQRWGGVGAAWERREGGVGALWERREGCVRAGCCCCVGVACCVVVWGQPERKHDVSGVRAAPEVMIEWCTSWHITFFLYLSMQLFSCLLMSLVLFLLMCLFWYLSRHYRTVVV